MSRAAGGNSSDEFYDAIRTNALTKLEMLIRSGADINLKDSLGETPLMYSAAVGSLDAMKGRRSSGFQRLAIGRQLHRRGHHLSAQRYVENFLVDLVPARLFAAFSGNLKLSARPRKREDVDFVAPHSVYTDS